MIDPDDFIRRHGKPVKHPDRALLWVFGDGAQYLEEGARGEAVFEEPSDLPVQRLFIQREFYRLRYDAVFAALHKAHEQLDVEAMQRLRDELEDIKAKLGPICKEYFAIPAVREAWERKEQEEREQQERDSRIQFARSQLTSERQRQATDLMREVGGHFPTPAETKGIDLNQFINDLTDKLDMAAARQRGIVLAKQRRRVPESEVIL